MPELDINYLKKLEANYTPNIPLAADPSRHDGKNFLIDNYAAEWDSNIRALEESRAQNQATYDKLFTGLGRVVNKIGVELASVPGYLVGVGEAMVTDKTIGEALDNWYLNSIKEYEHYVNENQLKVYTPESVRNGNLLDNLSSASFWATEGADGVGFLVSMMIPGNALKLAKLGARTGKATYGLGKAIEGTNTISKAGSKMFKTAGNAMYKNADDVLAAGVNAVIEGAAEAKEAYESTLNSLVQKYGDSLPEEELKQMAGEAASQVFKYNLGILSISNLFDQANLFGAFGTRKTMLGKMFSQGKLLSKEEITKAIIGKGFKDAALSGLKSVGAGLAKEGFYEEGMQFAASAFAESEALEDNKYNNILDAYVSNLGNVDMQKSIALGGILGGGMSAIGNYLENKRTKSALFGSDEIKRNKFQKLLGLQNVDKSFGLYDYINTSLSEREQSLLSAFDKDEKTGELKLNKQRALDLITKTESKSVLNNLLNIAALSDDKLTFERLKSMMDYQYFSNFFKYGDEGLSILKEHIRNDLSSREKQKYEANELLGLESTSEISKIASELSLKADEFYEIYKNNNDLHKIEFPSSLQGGDKETYNQFSDSIRRKKQDHALIDNINTKLIRDIDNEIIKLDLATEIGKKQAENLKNQKEEINKANQENQKLYNALFNKQSLQELYTEYLESKAKKDEASASENTGTENQSSENLTNDQLKEEYLNRLREAGYDTEGSREQPVFFQIGNDGYIANTAIGTTNRRLFNSQTGKEVGEFDLAYYKRNRDKIEFIPRERALQIRKRRKTLEFRRKQYNALVNIAFNTKNEFDSLSDQITERINKREELLSKIEEEKQELKKVTNEYGVAKKGYGEIKKLVLAQIKELENEINSLNEDIEILELYRQDLQDSLEAVEAYKQELQSMSLDEQFLFIQELRELESFESQPERLDENNLLEKIISDLQKTINSNIDLREELIKQRDILKDILDVYKNFYSMSIADKLLINTKISENKYQALLEKYPFLESYKRSQMMFLYKLKNKVKVKEFDTWQDYNENRNLKKDLYSNIENFVNGNPISLFGIPLNSVSIEEAINLVAEDIMTQLQGLSKISEDVENIEQHLNEAKAVEEEFNIINEEIKKLEDSINRAKSEYQNAKRLKDITDLSKKKLKFLKDNINEIAVQINKINVQAKNANASNTADTGGSDYRQQPPIEEISNDDFQFKDPFLSNQILRSIFPEVSWDENGRYIFDENGNPELNKKLNVRTISKFLNSKKEQLRKGEYSVKFYIPGNSKTPSDINDLFKSEYPEAGSVDIGFVIVDKNGEVVKEELDGVERIVYGFIPKSMKQETSPNGLRINNNALLQKYLATFEIYIADPIKSLRVDSLGFITNELIVKQIGKVKFEDLLQMSEDWVEEYYQNEIKKSIKEHIEKNDNTYLDIVGVTQGLMLKSNKLKDVQSVFGEGKVKIISIEDSTDKELGGFTPGTIVYESEGENFPVIQRTLTADEVETVINAIYLGWVDSKNGPFAGTAQEFGDDKYIIVNNKEQKAYRYYPGANSNISILSSLIYWGQYKREFYTGADGKKIPVAGKHKGEIFVESGILYFKDPTNNFQTLTAINLEDLGKSLLAGQVFTSNKYQPLINFLSNKRLNVNKELLKNRGLFFYPTIKVKDGKIVTTYQSYSNYNEFLLKGKSNSPRVLSTTATSKNTANRQIIFDTDLKNLPKLYSDKKKPEVKPETPKPITKLAEEVKTANINLDELNNTPISKLPDGNYTIKTSKGLEVDFEIQNGNIDKDKFPNVKKTAISSESNKSQSLNTLNEFADMVGSPTVLITNYQPFKQESEQQPEDIDDQIDELFNQQESVSDIEAKKADIAIGKVGNTSYEIKADGVFFDGKKLDNPENKTHKQLIEADIERRRQEELKRFEGRRANSVVKYNPDGQNTELTEDETEQVENLINIAKEKGLSVDRTQKLLQTNGFVQSVSNSPTAFKEFLKARLSGEIDNKVNGEFLNTINAKYDAELKALESKPESSINKILSDDNINTKLHKLGLRQLKLSDNIFNAPIKGISKEAAFRSMLMQIVENPIILKDMDFSKYLTKEDIEKVNSIKSVAQEFNKLNLEIDQKNNDHLKKYAELNTTLNNFVIKIFSPYLKQFGEDVKFEEVLLRDVQESSEYQGTSAEDLGIEDTDAFTTDRVISKEKYTKADIAKEKQWLKDKLGLTDSEVSIISGLIDGYAMGRFLSDGKILLSDIMEIGTAYHEAFHRVFQASLNNRQRQALIREFKKQPNWESKLLEEYKHLPIDRQIEEVLAEEFRDYVLAEGQIFSQPIKQTVFDRIFNFIKKLLGINTLTKEQLFEKINKGDFAKIKIKNNAYTQSDRITKIGDVELTPNEKSELFSAMNYYFFDGIFKVHENNSTNYISEKIDVKELYNTYVKNYIISDLKDAVKIFEAKKLKAIQDKNENLIKGWSIKLNRMNLIINSIENNFTDLNSEFSKQLEYFGLKTKFETEIVEEENLTPDNVIETNSETEGTSTGRTLDIISAVEFNTKDNLPNNFKMLIAALPDLKEDGSKNISSSLGLAQQANWGESVNILLNNLAGTPSNIDFIIEKIQKLSEKFPRYKTLIEYIGGDSKQFMSSKGFNNLNLVMLRREVVSALSKTKYNFLMGRIDDKGDYVLQNANSEQIKDRELNQAKSNIKQVFNDLGGKANYENKLNEAFITKNYVEGARLLGLNLTVKDLGKIIDGETIVDSLKKIYNLMSKNLNSSSFAVDAIYESKGDFATRKRIKDIINNVVDLNENIELQLINTEGKSVFPISLNTYQTLLIDEINFWIDKGSSREERLNLLSNNIPHLINVHNQNSTWLNHILEGNKLIYHLSDGVKNADELQGQHLSDLSPTDLMSFMINSTLSGYFISNKHADRSMFPTYVFQSGWDPIGYDNDALTVATDIMLGYLKDEVAKTQSLKRNSFYKDVVYYGSGEFKKGLFNGIISESLFNKLVNESINITHADISKQIKTFLKSVVEKDKKRIEELGLLQEYNGRFLKKKHIGISDLLSPFGVKDVKTKDRYGNTEKLLEHYSMMTYINHLEEFKLFNGDFSLYKTIADLNKRLNMQSSSGESLSVDNEINTYISNLNLDNFIKIDGEEFIYKDGEANGQIKELIIQDFNTISSVINEIADIYRKDLSKRVPADKVEQEVQFLIKAYQSMIENDGLSYSNIFSTREFSIRAGIWNNQKQNNFDLQLAYINKDEAKIKELTTVPKNQKPLDWFKENFEAFTNLKPQYLGPNYILDKESYTNLPIEDRHNIVAGRKTSYHPLIPMEIQGKILESMNLFMLKNGIDFIHLGGAAKFGTKIQRPFYKIEDNTTKGFNDFEIKDSEIGYLDYKYMKNQVRISPENKGNITTSTQARINIVEGLINDGVPIDYKDKNWDSLSEEEKLLKSDIYKNLKEYENIQFNLINSSIEDLLKEIGAVKVTDAYLIDNIENFKNLLVKLATDKNSPDNIIDILTDFTNTNSFIELLPNSTKIQNILFSLITKRVIVEKRPGDMHPQAASTGYESGERTLDEKGNFISNNEALKFFSFETDKDGVTKILPPEIIIPLPVKLLNDLLTKYKTRNIVEAVDLFNKDLEEGVAIVKVKGLRIPNQQLSSNDIFRVKKFGYPYLQGNVIVPTELVGKTGGDFDIDKVSVYYPNLDSDLNPVKYYDTHTDELFDQFLKNNKSEIYDEIEIDKNFKSFVSRLNNLKERLKSLDNKEANEAVIEYSKSVTGVEHKNVSDALNAVKDLKKSNRERINEINEILSKVYRENLDKAVEEKVYIKNFKDLENERESLKEQIKLIDVQLTNFYEAVDINKKNKAGFEKKKESAVKAIRTRKTNIKEEFRDEFLATPVSEINSKQALQNKMLEIEEALMLHPENLRNMLSPVADDELRSIAKPYLKSEAPTANQIPSASYSLDATIRFLAGKAGVGILATWITFNSKAQINNLKLAPTFKALDEDGTEYTTSLPDYFNVTDNNIGKIYNNFGTTVANALSAILTSQVDLVKDPYAKDVSLTEQTLNVVSYLLVRGAELKKIIEFINQPIISKYLDNQRLNESNVYKLTGKQSQFNPNGLVLSKDGLIDKTSEEFSKQPIQQKYLQDYVLIVEQSKAIGKVKNFMSPDTKTLKDKNDFKLYEELKTEVKTQNIIENLDQVFEAGKLLAGFKMGKELYMELYKQFFFTENPEIVASLDSFKKMILKNIKGPDLKNKVSNTIDENLITYLVQTRSDLFKGKFDKLMKGDKSLAKTLYRIKNDQHPKSKSLKNNILIKALQSLIENKNDIDVKDNVRLVKSKMITFENNNMLDAFEKVMAIDSNLANDIVLFNVFQSGFTNSPYQLQSIIPYKSLQIDVISEANRIIKETKNYEDILQQYFKDFLASHIQYVPTQRQFNNRNYSGYPFYKIKEGGKTFLTDGVNEFLPIGNVFGIDYNNHVMTSNLQNIDNKVLDGQSNINSKVLEGDIFSLSGIPVITTNLGGVHGAGLAQAAKAKGLIKQGDGNFKSESNVVQLPVKKVWSDSMAMNNNMELLQKSLKQLEDIANLNPDKTYLLPLAGLGHGEGKIENILPILINTVKNTSNIKLVLPGENVNLGRQGTIRKDYTRENLPKIKEYLSKEGLLNINNEKQTTQSDPLNEVDVIKNEIKEYVKLLSKEKQQEAMEIIRNFGPMKTVSDYGRLKEKICKV
jgi:hypothetical protein